MPQPAVQPSSNIPPNLPRHVSTSPPDTQPVTVHSDDTTVSSWATTLRWSSPDAKPVNVAAPWIDATEVLEDQNNADDGTLDSVPGQCNHVVFLACYNLAHEMMVRDVGMYAWSLPDSKDGQKSMSRIMRHYNQQLQGQIVGREVVVRTVPDPNKTAVQYHLQRARATAGLEPYVAVIYAAHGIQEPPTDAGELWCFDRSFDECVADGGLPTEYIPTLLFDILNQAGASTCFVWDCANAGRLLRSARVEAEDIDSQLRAHIAQNPLLAAGCYPQHSARMIHFAACGPDQALPRPRGMPDDLFTSCLLTPLRTALFFHNLQTVPLTSAEEELTTQRSTGFMLELWDHMSDSLRARLWSELRAIVHTMAWHHMDAKEYQRLFNQNGNLISGFATGFLLAQRVMLAYGATPDSIPAMPSCSGNNLWSHWDLILETFFEQLPSDFEEGGIDPSWEKDLTLVSFISDQLDSILSSTDSGAVFPVEHTGGAHPGLHKLPIICQAVGLSEYRETACVALATCLGACDNRTLIKAVQSGALDIALQLLDMGEIPLMDTLVRIWTSLVRSDACTRQLLSPLPGGGADQAEHRIDLFLDHLSQHSVKHTSGASARNVGAADEIQLTCLAAILSSILRFESMQTAPITAKRCLELAHTMSSIKSKPVRQWSILLIAAAIARLPAQNPDDGTSLLLSAAKGIVLGALADDVSDIRAAAAYAIRRRVERLTASPISPQPFEVTKTIVDIAMKLQEQICIEGSAGARFEIATAMESVLLGLGKWTTFVIFIRMLNWAGEELATVRELCKRATLDAAKSLKIGPGHKSVLQDIVKLTYTFGILRHDSAPRTRGVATHCIGGLAQAIVKCGGSEATAWALFRPAVWKNEVEWDEEKARNVVAALEHLVRHWRDSDHSHDSPPSEDKEDYAMFDRAKISLKTRLPDSRPAATEGESNIEQTALLDQNAKDARESTWTLRHRLVEDSLVVGEQQVGLPWRWRMTDIVSPERWTSIAFHSFFSILSAVNNSDMYILWDWAGGRKMAELKLDLAPGARIASAKFVNELHEQIVAVLEVDNGDMIVLLASAGDPSTLRRVSSWRAIEPNMKQVDRVFNQVVASWWRQSGNMITGGASDIINVWNCVSERKIRVFASQSQACCTTLITEPVNGNLFIAGFADGLVKLYDQRLARSTPLLSWLGDEAATDEGAINSKQGIAKLGVVLGESRTITSACYNGLINVHDLRFLPSPSASILVQPGGMTCASFQAHSGIMSTTSSLSAEGQIKWGAYRSTGSSLALVTEDTLSFDLGFDEVPQSSGTLCGPYSVIHPLRSFLAVGYGRECHLRGAGVGQGVDTDSGSYSFLRAQAGHLTV